MHASQEHQQVTLSLNLFEGRILRHVLDEVLKNYRRLPEEFDVKSAAAWYSTRGCTTAGLTAQETQEWLANLREIKGAHLGLIEDWIAQLSNFKASLSQVRLKIDDVPSLVTILNDHRLLSAARHDIGQAEMDLHTPAGIAKLPADRQAALYQIHFLACMMEELLRLLPNSGADWND